MLTRIDEPDAPAVSLEEAKEHLRVDQDLEDATITAYLDAAIEKVAAASMRAINQQSYRFTLNAWPSDYMHCPPWIDLPIAPIVDVSDVKYMDEDGAQQTLDAGHWYFRRTPSGGAIFFTEDFESPTLWGRAGDIEVNMIAGYDVEDGSTSGDPELKLPATLRQAILLTVGHWYANRENVVVGRVASELPDAAAALISQKRVYR